MNGAKTTGNNRTPRAANGGGGQGRQVEGVASVLITFEIDGPADIPIKQTNKCSRARRPLWRSYGDGSVTDGNSQHP